MPIIKVSHPKGNFTVLLNATVNDRALSYRALGVLVWLLSKPHDWEVRRSVIARERGESDSAIRAVLSELHAAGYAAREFHRDEQGKLRGSSLVIHGEPCSDRSVDIPNVGETDMLANRHSGKPTFRSATDDKGTIPLRTESPVQRKDRARNRLLRDLAAAVQADDKDSALALTEEIDALDYRCAP